MFNIVHKTVVLAHRYRYKTSVVAVLYSYTCNTILLNYANVIDFTEKRMRKLRADISTVYGNRVFVIFFLLSPVA